MTYADRESQASCWSRCRLVTDPAVSAARPALGLTGGSAPPFVCARVEPAPLEVRHPESTAYPARSLRPGQRKSCRHRLRSPCLGDVERPRHRRDRCDAIAHRNLTPRAPLCAEAIGNAEAPCGEHKPMLVPQTPFAETSPIRAAPFALLHSRMRKQRICSTWHLRSRAS